VSHTVRLRAAMKLVIFHLLRGGAKNPDLPAELHDTFAAAFNGAFEEGFKVLLRSISHQFAQPNQ
jgi:hypothetical protein